MNILDPRTWFQTKASAAGPAISEFHNGIPVWHDRDYASFAREGYVRNAIAFRCIAMKAQAVASVPFLLARGDVEIDAHPALDLLNRPAPGYTRGWLLESVATYIDLSGNAYIEGVSPNRRDAPPLELWSLRPDRMQVIAGPVGMPKGYRYEANGRITDWEVDPVTGRSDILHIRRFHPLDDWYGLSLVEPAAYAVDRHNEAGAHNMAVLQNGAAPSGMLVYKPVKAADGSEVSAPLAVIHEAEKRLLDRHTGSSNRGRPMVSNGNIDWVSFGMTMEQLQLTESKLDAARDICAALGVPIELLLPGQSTYNNKREAKLAFYEETVLPLAEQVIEHFNQWLLPRFGEDLALVPNLDEIEALSLRREIRQKNTMDLYTGGVISRDEAREALQFEPEPEMPQHKVDGPVLSALVAAAAKDDAMFVPLFAYLKSVGLVPRDQTIEAFAAETAGLFETDDTDAIAAALGGTDETEEEGATP